MQGIAKFHRRIDTQKPDMFFCNSEFRGTHQTLPMTKYPKLHTAVLIYKRGYMDIVHEIVVPCLFHFQHQTDYTNENINSNYQQLSFIYIKCSIWSHLENNSLPTVALNEKKHQLEYHLTFVF